MAMLRDIVTNYKEEKEDSSLQVSFLMGMYEYYFSYFSSSYFPYFIFLSFFFFITPPYFPLMVMVSFNFFANYINNL